MGLKKILLLTTDPKSGKGGISTSVANCAAILQRNGVSFEVITTHSPSANKIQNSLIFIKATLKVILSNPKRNNYFLHVGPKGSLLRKTILTFLIKIKKGKAYTQYHSPAFLNYLEKNGFWKLALSTLAKFSEQNLALNEYWKDTYEAHLTQKFLILPNPISSLSSENIPNRSTQTDKLINAICVARLVEEKNIEELIILTELNDKVQLKIVGGGPHENTLHQLASKSTAYDRITFTGWLSNLDVKKELSKSDIFILPSKYDSFGMVYIEALSEGVPVIAPSIPAVVDTLHGLKGVAHADSAPNINEAIKKVIHTASKDIRDSLEEKYGEKTYIKKIREIFR
ncbi:glycosyltransferase family 4 protein [Pseudomonas helleri]|uniref:Glycosyltransferase n=1 Tax=Pseudomonas helleri TaxID=1608996 RepID=A0A7X2BWP3_9PSED|nr:glycosyltransferase family 4 protein [Pseudomonas helleri]MQT77918.1 glycosyltransferase [Pseudomonas helleri]